MDVNYLFKAATRKSVNYSQRAAVLWPLIKSRSFTSDKTIDDVKTLQQWWRLKLVKMKEANWNPLQVTGKLQFSRNCPPEMVVVLTDKSMQCCNMVHFCPFVLAERLNDYF